jgi:acyl-CoA synthetase (AMP-forming)/AMP-acid ligase II
MQADYPLLIKQFLTTLLVNAPEQSIVYRDVSRYTYRTLRERIGRLASGLRARGVGHGDTVVILDWDSHRYLECSPMALVVARSGFAHRIDADGVRSHLAAHVDSGRISKYAMPEAIHFVDALPRTSVGKYDKRAMRERYQKKDETS